MAKHLKKDNIIDLDEAKQKILQNRENAEANAKHFRSKNYNDDEVNLGGYDKNAPIYNKHSINYTPEPEEEEIPDFNYDRNSRYERRKHDDKSPRTTGGKYAAEGPTIPRNLLNLIIVVVMTLILVIITAKFYSHYVVEDINVIGNQQVAYYDLMWLCDVEYKQSMLSIKPDKVIESIETKQPMIKVVDVKKIWPNILEIYVQERPPVCYIVLKGSQKCALIGENNVCLAIQDSYLEGKLPRIYGLDIGNAELGAEITDGESRKLELLKNLISAMLITDCIEELESINISNTTNIVMTSVHGTTIKIGDESNLEIKFSNTKTMLLHLLSQNNTDVTMIVTGDGKVYTE
ncbi:MAG: FtsQ-type POTRA domain-containing protein [Clostridia bacterium]|nr:FtsQ-type POTRA domain-containing protein [Clostridia bacterium]